ncbi:MAG: hypothetical protein Q9160_001165 [Pyrenula sp. 1 TL-2023]
MSISDLNLEPGISASIEETNITVDDIAQFIEGPDPVDNKWVCSPEMDERVDKAARTRRANEQGYQYASSSSGDSMSSIHSPPAETLESMSIRDSSPINDMAFFEAEPSNEHVALPPGFFSFTPPASPGYSTGNKPSPTHRSFTPTDLIDIVDLPSSPTPLQLPTSHESPPSLCNTSSSPVPEATMAYQFSDSTSGLLPELNKNMMHTDFDDLFDYSGMGPSDEEFFMD